LSGHENDTAVDGVASSSLTTANQTTTDMDISSTKKAAKTKSKRAKRQPLMEGETMTMLPMDLEQEWYAVRCPVGKRCWVISVAGRTISRLRNGKYSY
jgi:hypothetical protein